MSTLPRDVDGDPASVPAPTDRPGTEAAREPTVAELSRRGSIPSGRAAALLEMDRFDVVRHGAALGIPFFDLTEEEWATEVRVIEALTPSPPSAAATAPRPSRPEHRASVS